MTVGKLLRLLLPALLACGATAEAADSANGTATVRVDDREYTIPIVCSETESSEVDIYTEPQRITRERTGRASSVRLTIRSWKETDDVIVNVDRYVAWIPRDSISNGLVELSLSMSPTTLVQGGMPVAMTYDEWQSGNRPKGVDDVEIVADCSNLDPDAPAFRKTPAEN